MIIVTLGDISGLEDQLAGFELCSASQLSPEALGRAKAVVVGKGGDLSQLPQGVTTPMVIQLDDSCPRGRMLLSSEEARGGRLRRLLNSLDSSRELEVLARVSHDMRSPMAVISMACRLAGHQKTTPEQLDKHLRLINNSAQSLQTLINDILDFSKLDDGSFTLAEVEFDLEALLNDLHEGFTMLLDGRPVTLELEIEDEVPTRVIGDPGRLRQVLTNLLSNAVKFTSEGSIELFARGSGPLTFGVKDTGVGIRAEALERIFLPYSQASLDTLSRYGGTGLGLSICRRLVHRMGGDIRVESQWGAGSTFFFDADLKPADKAAEGGDLRLPAELKVLVVADRLPTTWDIAFDEADLNWRFEPSAAALKEGPYDLTIVGLDLVNFKALGELMSASLGKVLAMTAAGQRGDASAARELGISAYLTLPLSGEHVLRGMALVWNGSDNLVTRYTIRESYSD